MGVAERFSRFLDGITQTSAQIQTGKERRNAVVKCLNTYYYNNSSDSANSMFVGSWGKYTRIRPPRDVDVLFTLPTEVYERYQQKFGNRQSQLLQEVKNRLLKRFPDTDIRGDGPVVLIPFSAYSVEIIPAFKLNNSQYWICNTKHGGQYEVADYGAEAAHIRDSNESTKDNTRNLIRMMKKWQDYCSVPMKSFWIELLAVEFLNQWEHKEKGKLYYDWMCRDFLLFLVGRKDHTLYAPGSYSAMNIGSAWHSKAQSAYARAVRACDNEETYPLTAGEDWQKIFGLSIPRNA